MSVPFLDLRAQYGGLREELDAAVARVVHDQRFILGPEVEGLEEEVAAYLGVPRAVGCASGTDALLLSLRALGLEPGAEVVVPAFTFFATAGAVWNAGLKPVFADVDEDSLNLTAASMEAVLTERTRAVIVVHLYGRMADMDPILALCRERGIAVIEDAAQAFGARGAVGTRYESAGTVGDIGCLSFFPTKILGCYGDAGMVVTSDDLLAERVAKLRVHGGRQMYHHEMVGTNSRLDALQAAVLRTKLPRVDRWIEQRAAVADRYMEALAEAPVTLPPPPPSMGGRDVHNVFTVKVEERDSVRAGLEARGVASQVYYPVPLHLQACFASLGYGPGVFPVSERAAELVLSLPIYPEMPVTDVDAVVTALLDAAVPTSGAQHHR
ncbi:MAG: DegT/DnrJ/EryC1/StrS family aminotransferase [Gemmatimonadota bacterium]